MTHTLLCAAPVASFAAADPATTVDQKQYELPQREVPRERPPLPRPALTPG